MVLHQIAVSDKRLIFIFFCSIEIVSMLEYHRLQNFPDVNIITASLVSLSAGKSVAESQDTHFFSYFLLIYCSSEFLSLTTPERLISFGFPEFTAL